MTEHSVKIGKWTTFFLLSVLALSISDQRAAAEPLQEESLNRADQKIRIRVRKKGGTSKVLKKKLKVIVQKEPVRWQYLPQSSVSVPYVPLEFKNIPVDQGVSVLIQRQGKLKAKDGKYVLQYPLLKKREVLPITIISRSGQLEEWLVVVRVELRQSAVYVDENCQSYALKLKEKARPKDPNLIYVGCTAGNTPNRMTLELYWPGVTQVKYRDKVTQVGASTIALPLPHRRDTVSKLLARHEEGTQSVFDIEYKPTVPSPFELWAGLAFYQSEFKQSNFSSTYSQQAVAFLGKVWFRPEDTAVNAMIRSFGTLFSIKSELSPSIGQDEDVRTYFIDAELRYTLDFGRRWAFTPFVGGWLFLMYTQTQKFGLERVVVPLMGMELEKGFGPRDQVNLTFRYAPLLAFIDPTQIGFDEAYIEAELAYSHAFRQSGRIFLNFYYGLLKYSPGGGQPSTEGTYIVAGGGWGF